MGIDSDQDEYLRKQRVAEPKATAIFSTAGLTVTRVENGEGALEFMLEMTLPKAVVRRLEVMRLIRMLEAMVDAAGGHGGPTA